MAWTPRTGMRGNTTYCGPCGVTRVTKSWALVPLDGLGCYEA